jgi:membrane complex biogenesis BtpA family protein
MSASRRLPALVGVIHLPALAGTPGAPAAADALQRAGLLAVREAKALEQAGFDGLIIENFGDAPFYKTQVPPETIASMAIVCAAVREAVKIPIGVNVLRNDGRSALAIAAVAGCDFVRINVLSGVAATDQGLVEGDAALLLRERERLGAAHIAILGDVHVKHARSLSSDDIALGVEEIALRASANGVIITGSTTGRPVDFAHLEKAHSITHTHGIPLYVGSGATLKNLADLKRWATGIIVGSALRRGGRAGAPLDPKALKDFVKAFHRSAAPTAKKSRKPAKKTRKKR